MGENDATFDDREMRLAPTMAASALSGALARFPCHPIDTVKARIQTQTWHHNPGLYSGGLYRNFLHGLTEIWRVEGLRGLYRGFGPTVLGSIPASCLYFTTYETVKSSYTKWSATNNTSPYFVHIVGGMVAEAISCILWVPIDVVKERMQIQHIPRASSLVDVKKLHGDFFYSGGYDAFVSIIRTEGILGFYRGYGATVMSFGPFSALYFMFYEQLKRGIEKTLYDREGDRYVSEVPFSLLLLCGAAAGGGASLITNPLDMVKLRMQVQRQGNALALSNESQSENYRHMLDGLKKLYRSEGMKGMFRGVGARVAFHAPATAVGMALFEKLKSVTYNIM